MKEKAHSKIENHHYSRPHNQEIHFLTWFLSTIRGPEGDEIPHFVIVQAEEAFLRIIA